MTTRVAILGAGLAGLACAVGLRRAGLECQVYEREEVEARRGIGFLLLPEGVRVLEDWGLGAVVRGLGVAVTRSVHRTSTGRLIHDRPIPEHRCLLRDDILAALRAVLPASALHRGKRFVGFAPAERPERACFADGSDVRADVFLGADGRRSRVRSLLFAEDPLTPVPVVEMLSLVDAPELAAELADRLLKVWDPQGGLAVGVAPAGAGRVIWYLQYDDSRHPRPTSAGERAALAGELVGGWCPPLPALLERTEYERSIVVQVAVAPVPPRLARGAVALLGDAAHPLPTLLGLGANTALIDAAALTRHLAGAGAVVDALAAYDGERRPAAESLRGAGELKVREFFAPKEDRHG